MNRVLRTVFFALCTLVFLQPSFGQVAITVAFPPPAIPVYELPPCPGDGYLWTPGYWAWDPDYGYYWVPGTWVIAPQPGYLWTPGWWGWDNGAYIFNDGYWAPDVGFYGGINYGFGYFGVGFVGGRWDRGVFRYNTAVLNVNTTIIHNTYVDRTVIVNNTNRVSYNGGRGGIPAGPTSAQERVAQLRHIPPVTAQQQHIQTARANPDLRASQNQGKPAIAATARPGDFRGQGVVQAREAGAPYHAPPSHAAEVEPHQVTAPNTGNRQLDERNRNEQQQLVNRQNQEHQQLVQQQAREDQEARQRNYSQPQQQEMEQKHQQQTFHMEQQHSEQMHTMQTRQAPPPPKPR